MEHQVCDGAAKRMKHQKASWSKQGASNLGQILCKKVCGKLHQTVTSSIKGGITGAVYARDRGNSKRSKVSERRMEKAIFTQ
ncbi:MAG: hypothetical protein ACOX4J_07760 [Anaerovoracaceae bacterium]